jgi:RNA polymerase sigma-70 factor (ECF subfamily)
MPSDNLEHENLLRLLIKVSKGDSNAFSTLYETTSSQLYAIALKMLKRKELAEEATQEAYIKIWYNASQYQQQQGTVLTWMVSIVRYRALDMLRYSNRRKEQDFVDQDIPSEKLENIVENLNTTKLHICLEELSEQQRQAIYLAFFDGLSHSEVTNTLNSPIGTVKSWIRRGLDSLQRCLKR